MSSTKVSPDTAIFQRMAEIEARHGGFIARRQILDRAISRFTPTG